MPSGKLNNLLYQSLLPLAPSPRHRMNFRTEGQPLTSLKSCKHLLIKHHVLGASLMLKDRNRTAAMYMSLTGPHARTSSPETLFRVASLTKMVTAVCLMRLMDAKKLSLETPLKEYLPEAEKSLPKVTLRHLLSHTSGLRDLPITDQALAEGKPFPEVLDAPGCVACAPGETFAYCNLGFGLLGCAIEAVTGLNAADAIHGWVLEPLGMRGTLEGAGLNLESVMPITRVLSRHKAPDMRITPLGKKPLGAPDPLRHYGHTAGALYTDAKSLSVLLEMLSSGGLWNGEHFLSESAVTEMTREHAVYGKISPTLSYGLGILMIRDPKISPSRILGHQGFAYGCADGAFWEEDTGRQIVFLNGGCSEARTGRLGVANRDMLRWALRKELPAWK